MKNLIYTTALMKKLTVGLIALALLALPGRVLAEEVTICTQYYGGGVVCGVHTPVETGVADSIPAIAGALLGSSGIFFYLSKKGNKANSYQNN